MIGIFTLARLDKRVTKTQYPSNYHWLEDFVEQRGPILEFKTKFHTTNERGLILDKERTCIIPLALLVKVGLITFNQRTFTYQFTSKRWPTYFDGFEDEASGNFMVEEIGAVRLDRHECLGKVNFDKVTSEEAFWSKVESHFDKFLIIFLLIIICVLQARG